MVATLRRMTSPAPKVDGYRGIWFALGWKFEYGDKYSGGLGTYTANHQPVAIHAAAVRKTFFVYGGTPSSDSRQLLIMASYYDHARHLLPKPTVVHVDQGVDDPHDNASLQIDATGHLWIFKSGRNTTRPGVIYRSERPYSTEAFQRISSSVFTYPQVWYDATRGFMLLHTQYTRGRELYWRTSADGVAWSETRKLAGFDGHYQVSGYGHGKLATFFNWHPAGDNDRRTNIYYAQSTDFGETWTTADGKVLELPLATADNGALIANLQAEGGFMYTCDLNFDREGRPILLMIVGRAGEPGPKGDPREWTLYHWSGRAWEKRVITHSDHNYDMGSLHVHGDQWRVTGPMAVGPQRHATGGEMVQWISDDAGRTWRQEHQLTRASAFNHSYARRALTPEDPFFTFWADGHAGALSASTLYFANSSGSRVWRLPYNMTADFAPPIEVTLTPEPPAVPPSATPPIVQT
jgi:hypothetical protein